MHARRELPLCARPRRGLGAIRSAIIDGIFPRDGTVQSSQQVRAGVAPSASRTHAHAHAHAHSHAMLVRTRPRTRFGRAAGDDSKPKDCDRSDPTLPCRRHFGGPRYLRPSAASPHSLVLLIISWSAQLFPICTGPFPEAHKHSPLANPARSALRCALGQ